MMSTNSRKVGPAHHSRRPAFATQWWGGHSCLPLLALSISLLASGCNNKSSSTESAPVANQQGAAPNQPAPAKNSELLAQMSQIGQLQSSTTLTEGIQNMVLQNQIGSAGNLIGKTVAGLDDNDKPVGGIVNSVRVEDKNVVLELDNGNKLQLGRVTDVAETKASANGSISTGTTGANTGTTGTPAAA